MTKLIYGWILPDGGARVCEEFNHNPLELAIELGLETFKEEMAQVEECERECVETQQEGEHPEWHVWEMALDSLTSRAIEALYKAGVLRFGTFVSPKDGQHTMEFMGFAEGIRALTLSAQIFAQSKSCKPYFYMVEKNR